MLAIISKSPRTVSKYNPCSTPDHQTVIAACTRTAPTLQNWQPTGWARRAGFPSPGLCVLSRVSLGSSPATEAPTPKLGVSLQDPPSLFHSCVLGCGSTPWQSEVSQGMACAQWRSLLSHRGSWDEWLRLCVTCLGG